jgi:hypothetical protein
VIQLYKRGVPKGTRTDLAFHSAVFCSFFIPPLTTLRRIKWRLATAVQLHSPFLKILVVIFIYCVHLGKDAVLAVQFTLGAYAGWMVDCLIRIVMMELLLWCASCCCTVWQVQTPLAPFLCMWCT